MGVDVLGLPHTIMLTAANVNDRKGAVDMINYYCRNTDYLSDIKNVLFLKDTEQALRPFDLSFCKS